MGSGRRATIRIEGKTFREISSETGIREATLRARYFLGCTISDITGAHTDERFGWGIRIDGMTLAEIARKYGVPKGTIYWRYTHGYKTLEELTEERYGVRLRRKV